MVKSYLRESNIMQKPRIKISHKQGITIVELLDKNILKMDEATIDDISKSLFCLAEKDPPVKMLLSFARVEYCGSAMLGTLIRLAKRIVQGQGTLKLCFIKPSVYEIFVITKLNQILDIYEDEQTALNSFGG